jgi:hypothetical protein
MKIVTNIVSSTSFNVFDGTSFPAGNVISVEICAAVPLVVAVIGAVQWSH